MNTLDCWKPHKLEKHGIQQILEAHSLLETYGLDLSPSNRVIAKSLLASCVDPTPPSRTGTAPSYVFIYSAEDLRLLLKRKHLLARLKLARQYDRKAGEVLHRIKVGCMITWRSQRCERGLIYMSFVLQGHVAVISNLDPGLNRPTRLVIASDDSEARGRKFTFGCDIL